MSQTVLKKIQQEKEQLTTASQAQASPAGNLSSGAHPTATFPCDHLLGAPQSPSLGPAVIGGIASQRSPDTHAAKWAAPKNETPLEQLRAAVASEDWAASYCERKIICEMQASWSASSDRCAQLQCLCTLNDAKRILEIGAFCGVASLAMAEALPEDGEVLSLELDPFLAEFGRPFIQKSSGGHKIKQISGDAKVSLDNLAQEVATGKGFTPFDAVVIDADKANMKAYFDLITNTPGMLAERSVVCVDMKPFKGQPPTRYTRFGEADRWESHSGQEEIDAFRAFVTSSVEFTAHEFGGLLVVQRFNL